MVEFLFRLGLVLLVLIAFNMMPSQRQWKRVSLDDAPEEMDLDPGQVLANQRTFWGSIFIPVIVIYMVGVLQGVCGGESCDE